MTKLNEFINRFQFTLPVTRRTQRTASKSAAVLLPIINKTTPTLLLTQRSPFCVRMPDKWLSQEGHVTLKMAL